MCALCATNYSDLKQTPGKVLSNTKRLFEENALKFYPQDVGHFVRTILYWIAELSSLKSSNPNDAYMRQ